jgi:hypothetical protein
LKTLKQLVETYTPLERHELDFGQHSHRINRIVSCIDALPFDDWRSPVLLWLATKPDAARTQQFLEAIDALGLGLLVLGATKNTVTKRFAAILRDVVEETALTNPSSALYLSSTEKQKIRRRIKEPIPPRSRFATPLLLRLNADMLDADIPTYFPESATLEHILPQKPALRSKWREIFPDNEARQGLCQLMGNFTILTSKVNTRAKNYDFQKKKKVIFGSTDANTFPLTAQLTNYDEWTEQHILDRQELLIEKAGHILRL